MSDILRILLWDTFAWIGLFTITTLFSVCTFGENSCKIKSNTFNINYSNYTEENNNDT